MIQVDAGIYFQWLFCCYIEVLKQEEETSEDNSRAVKFNNNIAKAKNF